jgi:hypothetical protein
MEKPEIKCPECGSSNKERITCLKGESAPCALCVEMWGCMSCKLTWHQCYIGGTTVTGFDDEHFRCTYGCRNEAIIAAICKIEKQRKELEAALVDVIGFRCVRCGCSDSFEVRRREIKVRVCRKCDQEWHVCPIKRGVIAYLDTDSDDPYIECSHCVPEGAKKYIPRCPVCCLTSNVIRCACGFNCEHYGCTECAMTWHDCPHLAPDEERPIYHKQVDERHVYCYKCRGSQWMELHMETLRGKTPKPASPSGMNSKPAPAKPKAKPSSKISAKPIPK